MGLASLHWGQSETLLASTTFAPQIAKDVRQGILSPCIRLAIAQISSFDVFATDIDPLPTLGVDNAVSGLSAVLAGKIALAIRAPEPLSFQHGKC